MDLPRSFYDADVGRAAMVYLEENFPCFRRIACADRAMNFLELRNAFADWCHLAPTGSTVPHMYGVTCLGLDSVDVCMNVMVAGALLNAVVRHETRALVSSPGKAIVAGNIRAALCQMREGYGYTYASTDHFFNPFDVSCVLVASLHDDVGGQFAVAAAWLNSIQSAGWILRLVSARKIARCIVRSAMFTRAMERGYAPGGRIAVALEMMYSREFA